MRIFNPNDIVIDVASWYQAATERRELLAMDDRMLRDVGITRVDAVRLAGQPLPRIVRLRPPSGPLRLDPATIDAHIARAHRLREEAFRDVIFGAARALRDTVRALLPQPNVRARKLAPIAR